MRRLFYFTVAAILLCGCAKEEDGNGNTEETYGSIHGVISDKAGEPINAADVQLNPNGTKMTTGNDGSYEFDYLEVGEYTLIISKVGYIEQSVKITVKPGPPTKGDVQLTRSVTEVSGTITANGKPVESAAILITPGGSMKITEGDGKYYFGDLQPGRYELKVFKEGFQSFNKSIELVAGKDESLAITLTANTGKLSINKGFIDMGANANVAGFTILNNGTSDLTWKVTNAAAWIRKIDPEKDTIKVSAPQAVTLTIDRSKLSSNATDNYATLLLTGNDGSTTELLVTVFGSGNGINTTNDNSDLDYITIGDLYVQTKDLGGKIDWNSANTLCASSVVSDYNDWRLPTIEELATIYSKKEAIGGFNNDRPYWSSTLYTGSLYSSYWYLYFSDGRQGNYNSDTYSNSASLYCRAVRRDMLPEVSILPVSNISENSVTFNGQIDNAGAPAYTERGFVYATSRMPTISDTKVISYTSKNSTTFDEIITTLTMGVTYYVRAYATSSLTTAYSDELIVSITNQKAQVSTLPVTDIAATSAVFHGNIENKGIPAYTEKGFIYSATFQNPTVDNDKKEVTGTGTGDFNANISDLTTGTTYYVRAYATNSEGTAYGSSVSFTASDPNYVVLPTAKLMVQKEDIGAGRWSAMNSLCDNSMLAGYDNWRMPTKDELAVLYNERNTIGGFRTDGYWSSTPYNLGYRIDHWIQGFSNGEQYYTEDRFDCNCRCVHDLP